jgi:hypothetical protein
VFGHPYFCQAALEGGPGFPSVVVGVS